MAAALRHRIPSWGFLVIEPSSPGKLDTEKLTAAGVNPGPAYGKLKAGHKVSRFLQCPPCICGSLQQCNDDPDPMTMTR